MINKQSGNTNLQAELTPSGFSTLLGAAADAIIIINSVGEVLNFNPAAEKLFGYTAAEVENRNVKMLMPQPYRREHDEYLNHYNTTRVPQIIGIGRRVEARRKDSSIFPIELSVGEYLSDGMQYFVGIIRDLTEKENSVNALKESKTRLRERENELRLTIENAPAGILTTQMDGRIISANLAVCSLLGYCESELIDSDCANVVFQEDLAEVKSHQLDLIEGKKHSFTSSTRFLRRDGEIIYAILHCGVARGEADQKPLKLIVQIVDRTDQVKAENMVRQTQESLAHVDRISTMGEMASRIAHEINQPLSTISAYVQAGIRRLNSGSFDKDKMLELMSKTDEQSQRAGTIVKRIRALVRSQDRIHGRAIVNEIVADAVPLARADANSRGITLAVDLMAEQCETIADGIQIQQVILNLVRNAIDATEAADGNEPRIEMGTRYSENEDFVQVWVRDY